MDEKPPDPIIELDGNNMTTLLTNQDRLIELFTDARSVGEAVRIYRSDIFKNRGGRQNIQ